MVMNIVALAAFTIEITITSIFKQYYFKGFFFWLDVISTLSILLDISWPLFGSSDSSGASGVASLTRASRVSRVGTKAGRIVRLIGLVKLYKQAHEALVKEVENIIKFEQNGRGIACCIE